MVFSSLIFLVLFMPATILGYYLINPKFRNFFLLAMSLLFYFWGEPKFIVVMIISIIANYLFGLAVDKFRGKKTAKIFLAGSVIWNVGIFFIYKYLDFTIKNINLLLGINIPLKHILLPIGISFFTFQAMSYVIDVYRGNGSVQKNPINVALFLMMFPQLIAGPIVRYETVSSEMTNRKENLENFSEGLRRFIIGLGKKVIISNLVAVVANNAFNSTTASQLSVLMAWTGAISYTMQIYFDFSGYSDMAIGLGLMFGFHFNENFDHPYCSRTVSEFWRRWHISLGTWFRDYVYFPMGGSRVKSKGRLVFNLAVVWTLTGVWHGASWNFIIWGVMYFVILTFEKLTGIAKGIGNKAFAFLYRIFTLLCVMFGWVLFNSPSIRSAGGYILDMFGLLKNPVYTETDGYFIRQYILIIAAAILLSTPFIEKLISKKINENGTAIKDTAVYKVTEGIILILILITSVSFVAGNAYNPFIYFNF